MTKEVIHCSGIYSNYEVVESCNDCIDVVDCDAYMKYVVKYLPLIINEIETK